MSALALETTQRNIGAASDIIGMTPEELAHFSRPERTFALELDLKGTAAAEHAGATALQAWVVIHDTTLGPPRGGMSATPGVDGETVGAKGATMSVKNAIDPDPSFQFGGAKSGINTPEGLFRFLHKHEEDLDARRKLATEKEQVIYDVARAFVRAGLAEGALSTRIGRRDYTFAPDEGTNSAWMYATVEAMNNHENGRYVPALATGKPFRDPHDEEKLAGGLEGRPEATGRGLVDIYGNALTTDPYLIALTREGLSIRIAQHGFGNVNSYFYETLENEKAHNPLFKNSIVIAASDHTGSYFNEEGLQMGSFKTIRAIEEAELMPMTLDFAIRGDYKDDKDPRASLTSDCDVIVTAARANAIYTAEDLEKHPEIEFDGVLVDEIKAGVVLEGGNGAVTYNAQLRLAERNVNVYTGILANSGGSAASWDEYKHGKNLMRKPSTRPPSLERTRRRLDTAMDRRFAVVIGLATQQGLSIPDAAHVVAMRHLRQVA